MAKKLAKKDYDKDKGVKGKAIKKARAMKGKGKSKGNPFAKKSKKEETVSESTGIKQFINAISSKNYAQANKYLQGVIEVKLQQRISASLNEPLF